MLKWVFGADTSPFRRSLNDMRDDVKKFSASAKSQIAGMFGTGALTAWVASTIDAAGRIEDLSKRLNMSAESFQRLSYASKLSGGDMEITGKALTFLTKNLAEAANNSEKFESSAKALGVNLSDLAQMSPEGQMIELARGYAESSDKGAALAAIMKLLGKSGAEMIPMLAEGPQVLEQMLGEATVATNAQIAAMAKLGDQMDALKSKGVAALGSIIEGFKIWGASAEWALNKMFKGGDFADKRFGDELDRIRGIGKTVSPSGQGGDIEESAKVQQKMEEERKKLVEDIAKLEEDARVRALSLTEKILDAEQRRADLAAEAIFGEDESKSLESRKQQLEIEKEIAGYRKEQEAIEKKTREDKQSAIEKNAQEMVNLAERSAELDRSNMIAGMSDDERKSFFESERDKALSDQRDANARGDAKGGLEAGNKAKELTGQIDDITRSIAEQAKSELDSLRSQGPSIATSSLASIGGGGGARLTENDNSRRMVDLLAIIAANTAGGDQGSKPPEPVS